MHLWQKVLCLHFRKNVSANLKMANITAGGVSLQTVKSSAATRDSTFTVTAAQTHANYRDCYALKSANLKDTIARVKSTASVSTNFLAIGIVCSSTFFKGLNISVFAVK